MEHKKEFQWLAGQIHQWGALQTGQTVHPWINSYVGSQYHLQSFRTDRLSVVVRLIPTVPENEYESDLRR
eukprot:scaffold13387_cov89-Skeletonema_dohrnii-CCMP3373.AAC.1